MTNNLKPPLMDKDKLGALSQLLVDKFEDLADLFGIKVSARTDKMYYGPCPIHDGDNPQAWNMYYTGDTYAGNWKCRTHQCEHVFVNSMLGFLRGLLSKTKLGWSCPADKDKIYGFNETIKFALEFVDAKPGDIIVDKAAVLKNKEASNVLLFGQQRATIKNQLSREVVRKTLQIPAKYYLNRQYSSQTLDKYDVGLCNTPGKEMTGRAVVPIYDDTGNFMVGCSGRTIFDKCESCQCYHAPGKHQAEQYRKLPHNAKWRHSKGFRAEDYLYNFWFAKEHILQSGIAILVESPGNVWRLEESGIHNALGMFGTELTLKQKAILDRSGAMSLIVITDNDENNAGAIGAARIFEMCHKTYRLYFPKITAQDIGEMSGDQITTEIKPFIEQAIQAI